MSKISCEGCAVLPDIQENPKKAFKFFFGFSTAAVGCKNQNANILLSYHI